MPTIIMMLECMMAKTDETLRALGAPITTMRRSQLDYLPIALFGSVMGMAGLAAAWQLAGQLYGFPRWPAQVIGLLALLIFAVLSVAYLIKAISGPAAVLAEFRHPIAGNLFATPLISLLLLPLIVVDYSLIWARILWVIGAGGMLWFAWYRLTRWIAQRQQTAHATPAWMVPVVGLIDLPLAMPALHLEGYTQLMLFALAVGLFFAVPLFTLILARLMFEAPLAPPSPTVVADPAGTLLCRRLRLCHHLRPMGSRRRRLVHADAVYAECVDVTPPNTRAYLSLPAVMVGGWLSAGL